MMKSFFANVLVLCLVTTISSFAFANDKTAKKAFRAGSDLFDDGRFAEAAEQFRLAYELKPSWKLLYNIGQCETGAKRYGLALEVFEQYIVEGGDDITPARRSEVQNEIERIRTMVGILQIEGPDGAEIFIDDIKRGTLPTNGTVPVTAPSPMFCEQFWVTRF